MHTSKGKMLMLDWNTLHNYLANYPERVYNMPLLRNLTIIMASSFIIQMIFFYIREKSQHYTFDGFKYHIWWISWGAYCLLFVFHGGIIARDFIGLNPESSYSGVLLEALFLSSFLIIAFFLHRLGHNLICCYLGTPLWPWNPFVDKPDFDKIVARNQRENRKAWARAERKKREQGKRFSDD
jgi:amino acid permease